jgi:hypothetical protein
LFKLIAAFLVALLPTSAFAASGMLTCAVDPFSKDGLKSKQFLTVTYDGDGPNSKVTLQSPWGALVYDDALITGSAEAKKIAMMMGGERAAQLPDFAGMESCLSNSPPNQLHDFATLLGLVSDCGHTLAFGTAIPAQTLFGFNIDGDTAGLEMSISYSEDSTVASDYLEFRQTAVCKPLM